MVCSLISFSVTLNVYFYKNFNLWNAILMPVKSMCLQMDKAVKKGDKSISPYFLAKSSTILSLRHDSENYDGFHEKIPKKLEVGHISV